MMIPVYYHKEELHSRWLKQLSDFAWLRMSGKLECRAIVASLPEGEDFLFESKGEFPLPWASDLLIMTMALFSKCTFLKCEGIKVGPETVPARPIFCLSSLLQASFPKNVVTDRFKAHDGADVLELDETFADRNNWRSCEKYDHVAFAGLGVIMMNEVRKILNPASSDAEIIRMSDEHFLCVVQQDEEKNG